MKWILIALAGLSLTACAKKSDMTEYVCNPPAKVEVGYDDYKANIVVDGGKAVELRQSSSASGTMYEAEGIRWILKGGDATLIADGVLRTCTQAPSS